MIVREHNAPRKKIVSGGSAGNWYTKFFSKKFHQWSNERDGLLPSRMGKVKGQPGVYLVFVDSWH